MIPNFLISRTPKLIQLFNNQKQICKLVCCLDSIVLTPKYAVDRFMTQSVVLVSLN